mgnify:FL=1
MNINYFDVCKNFGIDAISSKKLKQGNINNTLIIESKDSKKYILQEINSHVFKDVEGLMNNIEKVTSHLKNKAKILGKDEKTCTLNLLYADGKSFVKVKDDSGTEHYFRMFDFIDSARTFNYASESLLFEAGVGFGEFQNLLLDFDADALVETIPNFHNTISRFRDFDAAVKQAKQENKKELSLAHNEIMFAYKNNGFAVPIQQAYENGKLLVRVVHNDTKLNNVMLDKNTNKATCVVDLDTIMPGTLLFDYGDGIRYAANDISEDSSRGNMSPFNIFKFEAFTDGFLSKTAVGLTRDELEFMALSPIVLAYELGLRFLTDYLTGNKYFKTDENRPMHNLDRAKNQFKLMEDMIRHYDKMDFYIRLCYKKYVNLEAEKKAENSKLKANQTSAQKTDFQNNKTEKEF